VIDAVDAHGQLELVIQDHNLSFRDNLCMVAINVLHTPRLDSRPHIIQKIILQCLMLNEKSISDDLHSSLYLLSGEALAM